MSAHKDGIAVPDRHAWIAPHKWLVQLYKAWANRKGRRVEVEIMLLLPA